ncbi:MAG: hypothetical protein M3N43_07050 [Actinomycetota bacterium]|nr:hypothetical protein [Actinomycetota bacterium]
MTMTRGQSAAEWRERQRVQREERLKEALALSEVRTGNTEAIYGRILLPGEQPSTAPIGSQENLFGIEESQVLTRPWDNG